MNTFTVQPETFEAILNRYAPHLELSLIHISEPTRPY